MKQQGKICDGMLPETGCPTRMDKAALIAGGRTFTYGWLEESVARLATGLRRRFRPGDILALWIENCPDLLCIYLACFRSGIVPMPLHQAMKWPEAQKILQLADAKGLIVSTAVGAWRSANASLPVRDVYVYGEGPRAPGQRSFAELTAPTGPAVVSDDDPGRDSGHPLLILLTSGSEGRPKGVMISRSSLDHIVEYRLRCTNLTSESVAVMASCLTQSLGLYQSLAMLAAGGTLVLLGSYDVDSMVGAVNHYLPTHLIMVADGYHKLLNDARINSASFRNIAFAAAGADRVTDRVQQKFIELTGQPLKVSYGLTESSWVLTNFEGGFEKRLSLGTPCPGIEVRLLDDKGSDVTAQEVGEIFVKSPRTMLGYLNDVEATRSVLRDGWLATGDLACRDDDGYYWFVGRRKNLVVLSSGDNVSPVEVERAALAHPWVANCLVVAGPDERDPEHEVPWMYVVRGNDALVESHVKTFLEDRLSAFKIPQRILFVAELPIGLTGKVMRQVSRASEDQTAAPQLTLTHRLTS